MCSITDVEIKHINKSLKELVEGQKENATALNKIEVHVAVSVERWNQEKRNWEIQGKANDEFSGDIKRIDRRDKIWNGANTLFVAIAAALGFR